MKIIALIVVVLIWMVISSIPRGSVEKSSDSWRDEASPRVSIQSDVKVTESANKSTDQKEAVSVREPSKKIVSLPSEPSSPQETIKEKASSRKAMGQKIVCQRPGAPKRSLITVIKQSGCELSYVKPESTETVARSHFSPKLCEVVRTKISKNLELAGFHCNDAS